MGGFKKIIFYLNNIGPTHSLSCYPSCLILLDTLYRELRRCHYFTPGPPTRTFKSVVQKNLCERNEPFVIFWWFSSI